jgi:hypothetical protein
MAYIGGDGHLTAWVVGSLQEDVLANSCIHLLEAAEPAEEENPSSEPSRGFIIQDWFGPFLLGPSSRFLRGRC